MGGILLLPYIILGYMAASKVWYSKRVYLVTDSVKFYAQKVAVAMFLGWVFIPIALIQILMERTNK